MIKKKNISNLVSLFLFSHLVLWTLIPSFSNQNLPLDTIEALAWGSNLDWGFNKHPPLSAFFVEVFYQIFGNQDWSYYLLSQIFVVLAFFTIWILSKDFFKDPIYGFISILLLEAIYFYNYTTPEFNVYVCELPFWTLTVFFCWRGFNNNKNMDWLLFGFFSALGILSHYLFLYLLIAIDVFFVYMILKKKINFKCFISLIPFCIVLLPHLIWLKENDYITFTYALHRTGLEEMNLFNHIKHPLIFLAKQIGILLPFFIMLSFIVLKFKTKFNFKDRKLLFLLTINIVPVFLMFLSSMFMGVKIKTMWMTPFYLFFGLFLVYFFKNQINLKKLKKFILMFLILFIFVPSAYFYVSISQTNKRTDYPGKEVAYLVQKRWDKNFSNDISIVIGDEWSAGNLSYHLKSRPKWFNTISKDVKTINTDGGFVYIGNPVILKEVCPGVFGTIKPTGICMIGKK